MVRTYQNGLQVGGAFEAGNMRWGVITVTPVANTNTSVTISGLSLAGAGSVHAFVTPLTTVPGNVLHECTVVDQTSSGFTIWIFRTNTTVTWLQWFVARRPT